MIRIAVLASGRGSDFQSIIDGIERGEVDAKIVILITDNASAGAIGKAKKHNIEWKAIERKDYPGREEHDGAIMKELERNGVELAVLAGYMRVIRNKQLLEKYKGKIINIHPSLLPKYPGAHAQKDAFEAGEKISGFTIHFVDESLDGGQIIYQEKVDISGCKSIDEAAERILKREHVGLPRIVDSFAKGKYEIRGREVKYSLNQK